MLSRVWSALKYAPTLQIVESFWVIGAKPHHHGKVADHGGVADPLRSTLHSVQFSLPSILLLLLYIVTYVFALFFYYFNFSVQNQTTNHDRNWLEGHSEGRCIMLHL